jgi:PAS domain-containing protein
MEVRDQATFVLAKRRWEDMVTRQGPTVSRKARPVEGDLLYFPLTKSLFEIKYVDFQNPFFQLNKIYVYRLVCELFEYSSEDLNTGITDIDAIETKYSQDLLEYQFQMETGELLLLEDGGSLIKEDFSTTIEPIDNTDFSNLLTVEGILDFSERNPFGEIGG